MTKTLLFQMRFWSGMPRLSVIADIEFRYAVPFEEVMKLRLKGRCGEYGQADRP
jgi:hypothetical protein